MEGKHRIFSSRRVLAIARGTFTQLVRMRALYFLAIFCVLIFALTALFSLLGQAQGELTSLRSVIMGVMNLFAVIFAVVGTAVLLPRDYEDRTLYTILSKPVPRFEYLLGKLLGLIMLIGLSLLIMDIVFSGIFHWRYTTILGQQTRPEDIELIQSQALTWGVQAAVLAFFFEAIVLASVTLLLSTVASTTLFTIIAGFAVFLIGLGQSTARDFFMSSVDSDVMVRILSVIVALIFPDFQMFNIVDGVAAGIPVEIFTMVKLAALTGFYVVIYIMASYLIFSEKEL